MTKKTKVIDPFQQELYQDTPWISRNRELNTQSYDLFKNQLGEIGKQDQQYYEGLASKAMQSAWGDYNRNYQKAVNQNLARNYGRTGSTASTSGGYVTDSLQRQYNDAAARLATQQAQYQDQFINSALNRDLAKLQAYYAPFQSSGTTTENKDYRNYIVDQENRQRQWTADATKKMNDPGKWGQIGQVGGQIVGTAIGSYFGGPVGGQIGGAVGGAAGGALGGQFDTQYVMPGQQASQSESGGFGLDQDMLGSLFSNFKKGGSKNLASNVSSPNTASTFSGSAGIFGG